MCGRGSTTGNPIHSRDVAQCRGRSRTSVELSMSDRDQFYPLDRRVWLLAWATAPGRVRRYSLRISQRSSNNSKCLPRGAAKKPVSPSWLADHPVSPRSDWDEGPDYPLLSGVATTSRRHL